MKKIILLFLLPILSYTQCNEGEFPIYMTTSTGEWAYEMSWGLWDYNSWMEGNPSPENSIIFFQGSENFQTESFDGCLPNSGCYMIAAYDSYGDGWNGGNLTVNVNNSKEPINYEMFNGTWEYWTFEVNSKLCNWEIPGCTNTEAVNYNDQATIDDGSCLLPNYFEWDNLQREYFLYIPENLQKNAALVFVLHGYWGEGSDMIGLFEDQADQYGFIVCYPTGLQDNYGTNHWNANFNEIMTSVDDTGFLTNLALKLHQDFNLNPEKTFSCGMSNGGYMSWSLACNAPETFKAIASVTGTMSGPDWEECNPNELIPVMQISGTNDNVVPMDGSMEYIDEGWGGAPDIYSIMDFWSSLHVCNETETTNYNFDYPTEKTTYSDCTDNSNELRLYVASGMGHDWPSFAEEEIWDFFMQVSDNNSVIEDNYSENELIKTIDILGREALENRFKIEIYKNGIAKKKYRL